jgi:hypothetical protein
MVGAGYNIRTDKTYKGFIFDIIALWDNNLNPTSSLPPHPFIRGGTR